MGEFIEALKVGELKEGALKGVSVAGQEILLARVKDRYYAAQNRCPHLGARLSEGTLKGSVITCPRHGSQFDLSNGQVIRWLKGAGLISAIGKILKTPRPLTTYNVKIEGDKVSVEV